MIDPTDSSAGLDDVAAYRPTDADLLTEWPSARRTHVLDRVLDAADLDEATPTRRGERTAVATTAGFHPRRKIAILVLPLAAAAAVVIPLLASRSDAPTTRPPVAVPVIAPVIAPVTPTSATYRQPARPVTIELLAAHAALTSTPPLPQRGFRHLLARETQDGHTVLLESWTAPNGAVWRRDTAADGSVSYFRMSPGDGTFDTPTPAYLRTLPTDPAQLQAFVRAHVSGSSSLDEAVYDYARMIVATGYAPADLRAAALRMLEDTGHVTAAAATDSLGRQAIRVDFTDTVYRPNEVQTLYFDPQTAALLEYGLDDTAGDATCRQPERKGGGTTPCHIDELHFRGTYTEATVVGSIPHDVRVNADAEPHK